MNSTDSLAEAGQYYSETILMCWKCSGDGLKPVKKSLQHFKLPCSVCKGSGKIEPLRRERTRKPYRPFKSTKFVRGPPAKYDMFDERIAPDEDVMLTSLCGHWMLYQLEYGHRMTSDDLLGAAITISHYEKVGSFPLTYLDIGTGLGSVMNLINWAFFGKLEQSVGVEAQNIHVKLARKTLHVNGLDDKCTIIHQDLRELVQKSGSQLSGKFNLITGTPPYFPESNGLLPHVLGRGMCAFELRGGVEIYCEVASIYLENLDSSRFIIVNTSLEISRTIQAAERFGFKIIERVDVHGIETKPSLFSVFIFGWGSKDDCSCSVMDISIRSKDGQFTDEHKQLMSLVGKPPPDYEPDTVPRKYKTEE